MKWGVEVTHNGESIVCIEDSCLSGKANLTDDDLVAIRTAAEHLLAFAGPAQPIKFTIAIDGEPPF